MRRCFARILAPIAGLTLVGSGALADYSLNIIETGRRDYYCLVTIELTNHTEQELTEINAFFLNYIGDKVVGRSKGASFSNVSPGGSASAVFETPNAPCADVMGYEMVIGACRLGPSFEEQHVCADRMRLEKPFKAATTLN